MKVNDRNNNNHKNTNDNNDENKNIITSFYKIVNTFSLSAVLTFIGYKQTNIQTNLYIDCT